MVLRLRLGGTSLEYSYRTPFPIDEEGPVSEGDTGIHWLVVAMERAQVGDATRCGLPTDAPMGKAWPWVADFLDVTEDDVTVAVARAFHLELADFSTTQASSRLVPVSPSGTGKTLMRLRIPRCC